MEAVFIKVLNMSISAGWLILAVMLLRLLLKKAPKWISVVLWGLVGLRLVLPFSLQSVFSLIPSAEVISPSIGYAQHPEINSGVSVIDNAVNPTLGTSLAATPMNSVNPMQIVLYLGGLVWVSGIVILLLYGLISYLRLRRKVTEAIPYEKNTWLCDQVKTPFILGVFHPRIYLPSGLNEKETAYVLAHERAHLKRKDHLWKPLGFLLLTVYWFNPLVWVAYILLCRDIEAACDEKVISDMAMAEKKAYANALVSCSMQRRLILACPLAFGEVGVKERVKGVLNYRKPAFWIILIAIIACIVLAVCLMTDPFSNKSLSGKLGVSMDMAVAGHNHSSETEGHFVALDYDVLQVSKTANRTTVYAWVMYEEYSYDGTDVKEESGSRIPTVITFDTSSENSDKSTYDVIEYWEPRDGSYYADDIRAKFPWSIRRKAFDVSGADQQHENCLRAAREYYGVGQNTAESSSEEFYLTIGADNVKSIVVTTPYTSGGCQNADGSLYRKGEQIWLEQLAGREDLRGVTITALDASETVIWTASVPNTEENRGFTRLTQDGWTISNLIDEAEDTPAACVDALFASGDITLTLYLADDGAHNTYPANEWYSDRFKVLLNCYKWAKLEMPSTEPSEFWLTAASADGTAKMTFWSDSGAGMVQYYDGNTTSFWGASPKNDYSASIAGDIRMEYDNLDVDASRISFNVEGGAQEAAEYFVYSAYRDHMTSLAPGSIYGMSDYAVVQWQVREISETGDAVVGSFEYAFTPWDLNSPGIWAGNTAEGTGEFEGKLTCYREFVLQQQENGSWYCIGLGTGGYKLPE